MTSIKTHLIIAAAMAVPILSSAAPIDGARRSVVHNSQSHQTARTAPPRTPLQTRRQDPINNPLATGAFGAGTQAVGTNFGLASKFATGGASRTLSATGRVVGNAGPALSGALAANDLRRGRVGSAVDRTVGTVAGGAVTAACTASTVGGGPVGIIVGRPACGALGGVTSWGASKASKAVRGLFR